MAAGDPFEFDSALDGFDVLGELVLSPKRILHSRDKQRWNFDVGEMFDAQLVRFSGRMQRVAKQNQSRGWQSFSHAD